MYFRNALACFILPFLLIASAGQAAPVPPISVSPASKNLSVVDATGKKVGNVFITSPFFVLYPFVALAIGKQTVLFKSSKDGLSNDTSQVNFESPDCSGPGFFWNDNTILWPLAYAKILYSKVPGEEAIRTGNILYLADPTGTPKNIIIQSSFRSDGVCQNQNPSGYQELIPSMPVIDLDKVFTPPYRLR